MKHKLFAATIGALVPLYTAICFAGSPLLARAESASSYWAGIEASGAMLKGESSPVVVENAKLNLKIATLPRDGKLELNSYRAEATTEYTFYNPTSSQVDMAMLFPFGTFPSYMSEEAEDTVSAVTVGGEAADCTVRYTYSSYTFNAGRDAERVYERRKSDSFYRSSARVREYSVLLSAPVGTKDCYVKIKLGYNAKKTRVLFPAGTARLIVSGGDMYAYLMLNVTQKPTAVFYAVGDPIPLDNITPMLLQEAENVAVFASAVRDFAFEELAMMNWSEDTGVSETDWYNAFLDMLNDKSLSGGSVDSVRLTMDDLMRWYEFNVQVAPKERIVSKVTTPLYPAVEAGQNPRYEYNYLLSPAAKWADFQNLEIYIDTPYLLSTGSLDFIKEERASGEGFFYRCTRSALPQGELTFVLTEADTGTGEIGVYDNSFLWPSLTWAFGTLVAVTILAGVVGLSIILSIRRKRRQ